MKQRAAVIIVAAGSGSRMHTVVPKQYLALAGTPIIIRSIRPFTRCPFIEQIIVVVPDDRIEQTTALLAQYRLDGPTYSVVAGGRRRQDSVRCGLAQVKDELDIVLVHDGARPLVSPQLIESCYREIIAAGAAIAAVPVKDTVKRSDADHLISATVDRTALWLAQTPQGAWKKVLVDAFARLADADVTDEASLLEQAGIPVRLVRGEETNLKITSPEDLPLAELIMATHTPIMRIGHGFDAHRFAKQRRLVLGGVAIDYHLGLAGHSDADVVTHALCDALLGALGLGDIGHHFPDNDSAFKDIVSLSLLDQVMELAATRDFELVNADLTVVCQAPRLAPFIEQMRSTLASHCRCETGSINIKATTTEGMGYTGRGEGICCHAVVLLHEHSR
ncbi:MAG: 2-C-methyl-D-erythritol 4-phosphate cytidylyltransferase [Desulfofustis sp.]|nr:2-C-methyl-D-erythritol 4-phosphate cytidylyltransferase [Desulfofustis sp.]